MRSALSGLLNLCLGLFLIDGVVSLIDDTLLLFFGIGALSLVRGFLALPLTALAIVIYLLMGVTPMVPKRLFLPVVLFYPLGLLAMIPFAIYHPAEIQRCAWALSLLQVSTGVMVLRALHGRWRLQWPNLDEHRLGLKRFSWLNLITFVVVNCALLVPGIAIYLAKCGSLAVDRYSAGFLVLHADGLAVQSRAYTNTMQKTVSLIPMIHVAEPSFYRTVNRVIGSNSVVLAEGVTDEKNLLTNKLSYHRMASSLGLAEQQETFAPIGANTRRADVDVSDFSPSTVDFLNLLTRIHTRGLSLEIIQDLIERSQSPALTSQLWEDLLTLRNRHLLQKIGDELSRGDQLAVPWGAAHMPGLAQGLEELGFRMARSEEVRVLYFRTLWTKGSGAARR